MLDAVKLSLPYSEEKEAALRSFLAAFPDITVEKEKDVLLLKAKGVSAHASMPDGSKNAAYLLFSALSECTAISEGDRAILKNAAHVLEKTDGSAFGLNKEEKEFSPLTMANGIVRTEEGRLAFSLDIRYGTAVGEKELEEKLAVTAALHGFSLSVKENHEGFLCDKGGKALFAVLDACEDFSGTRPEPFTMGGGTYARHLKNAYSVATSVPYIPDPFDAPEGHGGAHQADEHLPVDAFLENAALVTDVLLRLSAL